jgi:hypothetical protein
MATCKNGFGRMASSIIGPEVATSFEGMQRFTLLMIQLILVMVPLVLLINGLTNIIGQRRSSFQSRINA